MPWVSSYLFLDCSPMSCCVYFVVLCSVMGSFSLTFLRSIFVYELYFQQLFNFYFVFALNVLFVLTGRL
jgi:hypothetical protein